MAITGLNAARNMLKLYMDDPQGDQFTSVEYGDFLDQAYRDVMNKVSHVPTPWGIAAKTDLTIVAGTREYQLDKDTSYIDDVVQVFDDGTESTPWRSVPYSYRNHTLANTSKLYYVYRAVEPVLLRFLLGIVAQHTSGGFTLRVTYRRTVGTGEGTPPSIANGFLYIPKDHEGVIAIRAAIIAKGCQNKEIGTLPARYAEGISDLRSYLGRLVRKVTPMRAH